MTTRPHIVHLLPSAATDWQAQERVQGNLDLPAGSAGMQAVLATTDRWHPAAPPRVIYTAPDEASRQTAAAYGSAASVSGVKIKALDELREINLGLWQGLTYAEMKERYPTALNQWRQDISKVTAPQGETFADVSLRLKATLTRLIEKAGGDTLAFVLRPVSLALVAAWLSGQEGRGGAEKLPSPEPHTFNLDEATWRRIRHSRRPRPDEPDTRRIPA